MAAPSSRSDTLARSPRRALNINDAKELGLTGFSLIIAQATAGLLSELTTLSETTAGLLGILAGGAYVLIHRWIVGPRQ